jgi:subtilisin family serine protease
MIRQTFLRSVATMFLASALFSCGDVKRPVEPVSRSYISRTGAAPAGLIPIAGGWVVDAQAVVVLKSNVAISDFLTRNQLTQVVVVRVGQTDYILVERHGLPVDELVNSLRLQENDVESADYNHALEAPEYEGTPMSFDDQNGTLTSTNYNQQRFLGIIRQPEALTVATGFGARVAILDTGVDAGHPGWSSPPTSMELGLDWTILPPGPRAEETADDVDQDGDGSPHEAHGHGTHVAGIVHLTAPGATLIPIRVLSDDGWGTSIGLAGGIVDAMTRQANIINMSLGLGQDVEIVRDAVDLAIQHGIGVVASAGNSPSGIDQYPASYHGVVSVTAVDRYDHVASFANHGTRVRMSAPGVGVISLYARAPGHGSYALGNGTSMAAPFAAGAAALVLSNQDGLTGVVATEMVINSSTPIDDLNPSVAGLIGHGRVDLRAPLQGEWVPLDPPDDEVFPSPSPSPSGYPTIKPKP